MSKLNWDQATTRLYETGVEKGVLFPFKNGAYQNGVAWNGLISVTESPSGAEPTPLYADNIKYLNLMSTEELGATIEAYTYPDEFAECDGSASVATGVSIGQQHRIPFALAYETKVGNDSDGNDHGYKIHIIYGALAAPTERGYSTINDSPEAITFSWSLTTTPVEVNVEGKKYKPTASIVIDSTKVADTDALTELRNMLYGVDPDVEASEPGSDPTLPMPEDIIEMFGGTPEPDDDDDDDAEGGAI